MRASAKSDLNTDLLCAAVSWYRVSREIAEQERFQHWEQAFPEILGSGASQAHGFDLILGNPPWIKVFWTDAPLLGDYDPMLGVKEVRSAEFNQRRLPLLQDEWQRTMYFNAQRSSLGVVALLATNG